MTGAEPSALFARAEADAVFAARRLAEILSRGRRSIVLAESCTAGLASDLIARAGGASAALWGSFVCYSPEAKERMLGLDGSLLRRHGPASMEAAREMAICALRKSGAWASAAVTGIAGPLGDGSAAPVGAVWIALAVRGEGGTGEMPAAEREMRFLGDRAEVRMQAAGAVLRELLDLAAALRIENCGPQGA